MERANDSCWGCNQGLPCTLRVPEGPIYWVAKSSLLHVASFHSGQGFVDSKRAKCTSDPSAFQIDTFHSPVAVIYSIYTVYILY